MLKIDWINRWSQQAVWLTVAAGLCLIPASSLAQGSSYVPPVVATSTSTVPATGLPGNLGDVALAACGNIYTYLSLYWTWGPKDAANTYRIRRGSGLTS